ncbi:MAG: P-II family nitrogen regulator [Candidatus Methanofastidiosa archaeon]|nr:P-II family nitrogen regulator [Candidatus Methanofastidiosa archaeon]
MKKVEAIIRPEKFEELKMALTENGFVSMTVQDVRGRGTQGGIERQWRGRSYKVDLLPKIKIFIVAKDQEVERLIGIIRDSVYTGGIGDGKIFVYPVDKAITVRTGVVEEGVQ